MNLCRLQNVGFSEWVIGNFDSFWNYIFHGKSTNKEKSTKHTYFYWKNKIAIKISIYFKFKQLIVCIICVRAKGQTTSKLFFQTDVSSKKWMKEFFFTTMKPQVDLFSFVFWRKLKTPKRHFEITWPLESILGNAT